MYPLLIAVLTILDINALDAALLVSQLAGVLFSIFAFFYVRSLTNNVIALVTVFSIQLTHVYFNYFSMALTEAPFIALVLISLFFLNQVASSSEEEKLPYVILGILSGLVFLTRELGISVIIFFTVFMLARDLFRRKLSIIRYVLLFAGFAVLVLPYYTVRFIQTGQEPLSTSYRAGDYSVHVDDQSVLDYIDSIRQVKSEEYHDAYRKRRALMQLLPDSSEMLGSIIVERKNSGVQEDAGLPDSLKVFGLLANPVGYVKNFGDKSGLLAATLGTVLFVLFIVLLIVLVINGQESSKGIRFIIPGFIFVYLLVVSMFDTEISRYIEILCPLVLLFIATELYLQCNSAIRFIPDCKPVYISVVLSVFLPAAVIAGTPQLFLEKKIYRTNPGLEEKLEEMGQVINGEPVFTLFPSYAHSVNGDFRTLPNDTLDKISIYADRTGVNWLLVAKVPSEEEVVKLWNLAWPWLTSGNLTGQYGNLVEYHSGFYDEPSDTDWRLYRFRNRQIE